MIILKLTCLPTVKIHIMDTFAMNATQKNCKNSCSLPPSTGLAAPKPTVCLISYQGTPHIGHTMLIVGATWKVHENQQACYHSQKNGMYLPSLSTGLRVPMAMPLPQQMCTSVKLHHVVHTARTDWGDNNDTFWCCRSLVRSVFDLQLFAAAPRRNTSLSCSSNGLTPLILKSLLPVMTRANALTSHLQD